MSLSRINNYYKFYLYMLVLYYFNINVEYPLFIVIIFFPYEKRPAQEMGRAFGAAVYYLLLS